MTLRTNIDDNVTVGPAHPLRVVCDPQTGEPRPYVRLHRGLEARLSRPVFYELVEETPAGAADADSAGADFGDADFGDADFGVWAGGRFWPLGSLDGEAV